MAIASKTDSAVSHAAELRRGGEPVPLGGVDEDNTLAESGVYNTYSRLSGLYTEALQAMRADAANIEAAAYLLEESDSLSAKGFR